MKVILISILMNLLVLPLNSQITHKESMIIMACDFEITVIANDQKEAESYIQIAVREMRRIESLISSWNPKSETSLVNAYAGRKEIQVSKEVYDLISRSKQISSITDGAFDISYAAMDKIWRFDGKEYSMPHIEELQESVSKVGFEKIILNEKDQTVFLSDEGMKIAFGAIGKGYAADRAKAILQKAGVKGGIINASGDINAWGKQINGEDWKVAITNPLDKSTSYGLLPLKSGAVVTSGNYEKFILIDGLRHAHIIDPRSGIPCKGIMSVTVFAPSAELADALATSVFVLGIEIGLNRIEQIPKVDCIIIDSDGLIHSSQNIEIAKS